MLTLRRVTALADFPRRRMIASVVLGALTVCLGVALMATAGYLISRAAEQPPILSLGVAIVAVRFFGLSRPIARYLERLVSHDQALSSLGKIRSRFYQRIEPLAPGELEAYRSGDLLTRMVGDVDTLQGLFLRGLGPWLVALVAGTLCVVAAWWISPPAGSILAAGLVLACVLPPSIAGWLGRATARRQEARAELTGVLIELLRCTPELAVYGRQDDTLAEVRRLDGALARLEHRDALVAGLGDALMAIVTGLTVAGVLATSVTARSAGELDRVLLAVLALLALSSFEAVAPLPLSARELSTNLAAGGRVLELTDREPAVRDPSSPLAAPNDPTVRLEDVTARYPMSDEPALSHFDLNLEPGSRIALVGPSGAGKTTVANLLLRFLDPERGQITIGGRDIRAYRQDDVRRTFAVAGQDAHIFDSSIRANLMLARPDATDADLEQALRRARLDQWVASTPLGLETSVGEEGRQLSGGQRQRLTLARALLTDAPVLVLDEPTAHLDAATAEGLMSDIFDTAGDRTILLITHRREGLDRVDQIVTLDAGRVVGRQRNVTA